MIFTIAGVAGLIALISLYLVADDIGEFAMGSVLFAFLGVVLAYVMVDAILGMLAASGPLFFLFGLLLPVAPIVGVILAFLIAILIVRIA